MPSILSQFKKYTEINLLTRADISKSKTSNNIFYFTICCPYHNDHIDRITKKYLLDKHGLTVESWTTSANLISGNVVTEYNTYKENKNKEPKRE